MTQLMSSSVDPPHPWQSSLYYSASVCCKSHSCEILQFGMEILTCWRKRVTLFPSGDTWHLKLVKDVFLMAFCGVFTHFQRWLQYWGLSTRDRIAHRCRHVHHIAASKKLVVYLQLDNIADREKCSSCYWWGIYLINYWNTFDTWHYGISLHVREREYLPSM